MKYLVTGTAGFIGLHLAERLLTEGHEVVGIDNLNDYYDVELKHARLARLEGRKGYRFTRLDLADREATAAVFARERPERVIHLAAQAGVRYSLDHPLAYADSNLVGHLNVLEGCRRTEVRHLLYASSSSVYGLNQRTPFSTSDRTDHPVSLNAATKKANELMSHSYAHLYGLPTTGLRFFTVYGPWGRPDMAYFKFTRAILEDRPIDVYNNGEMRRDFTYIDDIVEGIMRLAPLAPEANAAWTVETGAPSESSAPYRVVNIGNSQPEPLMRFIRELEQALGRKARLNMLPLQPGDVLETVADTSSLEALTGFRPHTDLPVGLARFVAWYREFHAR